MTISMELEGEANFDLQIVGGAVLAQVRDW